MFLLASQLLVSVMLGFLAMRAFQHYRSWQDRTIRSNANIPYWEWPGGLKWIHAVAQLFSAPASRLAKPSERVRHALWCIGADHRLTDIEFSRLCWSISLLLATATGVAWILLWLIRLSVSPTLMISVMALSAAVPLLLPRVKLMDLAVSAHQNIGRTFPSFLDVLALTLESGQNFQSALQLAVQRMPGHGSSRSLRRQLQEVLRSIRSGQSRQQALQQLALRVNLQEVVQFAASMSTAESQGVSVTALLRRQSEQLRTSRSLAAERHAMKLPVKLLAPLAICIFPCTFLVIAFPIAIRLSQSGLF